MQCRPHMARGNQSLASEIGDSLQSHPWDTAVHPCGLPSFRHTAILKQFTKPKKLQALAFSWAAEGASMLPALVDHQGQPEVSSLELYLASIPHSPDTQIPQHNSSILQTCLPLMHMPQVGVFSLLKANSCLKHSSNFTLSPTTWLSDPANVLLILHIFQVIFTPMLMLISINIIYNITNLSITKQASGRPGLLSTCHQLFWALFFPFSGSGSGEMERESPAQPQPYLEPRCSCRRLSIT